MQKDNLAIQLDDLGKNEEEQFKKIAYFRAAKIIKEMTDAEFQSRSDFLDIKGIGEAINKKIIQFKTQGFIEKWKKIKGDNLF